MCEPKTSIVQYPGEDDNTGESNQGRMEKGLAGTGLWRFLKKISKYFLLFEAGSGHSESIRWARTKHLILPDETARYEGIWWNRDFVVDGSIHLSDAGLRKEAMDTARIYYDHVCNGNLGKLRNFLELSIANTQQPAEYFERMPLMLNKRGQEELFKKGAIILHNHKKDVRPSYFLQETSWTKIVRAIMTSASTIKESTLKAFLGLTRKRELLIPEWADDRLLWEK